MLTPYSSVLPSGPAVGPFGGRLAYVSPTTIAVLPTTGSLVTVGSLVLALDGTGVVCDIADDLILSDGTDSGAPSVGLESLHVYMSTQDAFPFPMSLRMSSTAPTSVEGVQLLGATGNAAQWRHVGWVFTGFGPVSFVNTDRARNVVTRFNSLGTPVLVTPNYVDDDTDDTFAGAAANWAYAPGNSRFSFIGWGGAFELSLTMTLAVPDVLGNAYAAIGIDFTGGGSSPQAMAAICWDRGLIGNVPGSASYVLQTVEGQLYEAGILIRAAGGAAPTWYSSFARNGNTADPFGCVMSGVLPA
jgi:hypothetical protein